MATITSGLYKIVLLQTLAGQNLLNTFFYEETLGQDDKQEDVAKAFDQDVMPNIADIQHTTVAYVSIRAINVTGTLADFISAPTLPAGVLTGTVLNTFTSAGIRLNRTTKETNNGQKRFAGGTEEVAEGQSWAAGYLGSLDALGAVLAFGIDWLGVSFIPVIGSDHLQAPGDWLSNPVAGFTTNPFITSQVSRKRGVGF